MSIEFLSITVLNLFILAVFGVSVFGNSIIPRKQKLNFIRTIVLIGLINVIEVLTLILDNSPLQFRFLHILTNFVGFALAPLVAYSLSTSILPDKRIIFFEALYAVYFVLFVITLIIGKYSVFHVSETNSYSRDVGFYYYLFMLILSYVIFILQNVKLGKRLMVEYRIQLISNALFVLAGCGAQIINPQIHTTWISVSVSVILYYIYHVEYTIRLDSQTGLLNYNCFLQRIQRVKGNPIIVVIVMDNFKKYQEHYNRIAADSILVKVAHHISEFYQSFGTCYRLGTDEFCVVIKRTEINVHELNKTFFKELSMESMDMEELPLVSIGVTQFSKDKTLNDLFSETDKDRRLFIRDRIEMFYN